AQRNAQCILEERRTGPLGTVRAAQPDRLVTELSGLDAERDHAKDRDDAKTRMGFIFDGAR
ncbi:MAG: hypothetical protein WAV27_14410, partial [Xanthobacteraceae bacterium]